MGTGSSSGTQLFYNDIGMNMSMIGAKVYSQIMWKKYDPEYDHVQECNGINVRD